MTAISLLLLALSEPAAGGRVAGTSAFTAGDEAAPVQIFEKRILPIFKSPDPSNRTQCRLAAVDLKCYILPSHE
jgi:hypothetical protein